MPLQPTQRTEKQRLKDEVMRLENSIAYANRGIKTSKQFAEGVDYSEELRAKSLAKLEDDEAKVKDLKKKLEKAKKSLNDIVAEERSEKGKEKAKVIEDKYAKLEEALALQLDPESDSAEKIRDDMEALVDDYQSALTAVNKRPASIASARAKLFGKKIATFGAPEKEAKPQAKPRVVAEQVVETPVAGVTGQTDKKPTPDKVTPSKPKVKQEVTTRNPVTGEVIKVSDIKPATGEAPEKVEVGPNALPPVDRTAGGLGIAEKYDLSEALFKNVDSLNKIYEQYVNPKSKMTDEEFIRRIQNDVWYKKNSKGIKQRFVQYYNYQDLVKTGQIDPAVPGTTQYEQDIESIVRSLEKRAAEIGSAAASNPTALRQAAENLYITNKEKDTTFVDDLLASSIRAVAGTIGGKTTEGYSGEALKNYNELVKAARNNGFQLADIIPGGASVDQVLQGVATGKIDVNRVIADARKMAAQGQPQYVRDLLAQGYNLDQVFKPYRTAMANVLEIGDPDQIDLNDPLLRSAITDKGDMNLYDFKKQLKADNRWQYTENARQEVSTAALSVLRDFGFQG
jgi:exonuclease VII small subunit